MRTFSGGTMNITVKQKHEKDIFIFIIGTITLVILAIPLYGRGHLGDTSLCIYGRLRDLLSGLLLIEKSK